MNKKGYISRWPVLASQMEPQNLNSSKIKYQLLPQENRKEEEEADCRHEEKRDGVGVGDYLH